MKVKICGITNLEDAQAAIEAGADLLGFNFYPPSPRSISPAKCTAIQAALARAGLSAVSVGVFVNASPSQVAAVLDECGLSLAQLSGDEPPQDLEAIGGRAYKALRPGDRMCLAEIASLYLPQSSAPTWLVDAYQPGQYGGTGHPADWSQAYALARQGALLLAGGLRPDNVAAAIAQVHPWGVDVASGVESAPGKKDRKLMVDFICTVRHFSLEHDL